MEIIIQMDDFGINISTLDDGPHTLLINAIDKFGLQNSQTFEFVVDKTSPTVELLTQQQYSLFQNDLIYKYQLSDKNLPESDYLSYLLPNGERIIDKKSYSFDTSDLEEGTLLRLMYL